MQVGQRTTDSIEAVCEARDVLGGADDVGLWEGSEGQRRELTGALARLQQVRLGAAAAVSLCRRPRSALSVSCLAMRVWR